MTRKSARVSTPRNGSQSAQPQSSPATQNQETMEVMIKKIMTYFLIGVVITIIAVIAFAHNLQTVEDILKKVTFVESSNSANTSFLLDLVAPEHPYYNHASDLIAYVTLATATNGNNVAFVESAKTTLSLLDNLFFAYVLCMIGVVILLGFQLGLHTGLKTNLNPT